MNIKHKAIALWENPYNLLQKEIRQIVKKELSRHNGIISLAKVQSITGVNEKTISRLFIKLENGCLEWKSDIIDESILTKRLGKKPSDELIKLFFESRYIEKRTKYPYLVYANRHNLQKANFMDPVFGFDILIRPITKFSETEEHASGIKYGNTQLILFVHLPILEDIIFYDSNNTMFRLGIGEFGVSFGLPCKIKAGLTDQTDFFIKLLNAKRHEEFARTFLQTLQRTIHRTLFSGI